MKFKPSNCKGITLAELVIAVVIMGIASALAVPVFGRVMYKLKLNAATRDITSDLRWARSQSISKRVQYGLNFDFANKTYRVFYDKDNPAGFLYNAAADSVVKVGDLSTIGTSSSTFANNTVIFKPDGSCNTSGTITCYSTNSSNSKTVGVLASTGRIKVNS